MTRIILVLSVLIFIRTVTARDLERSPGSGLLYVLHDSGRLGLIRA